MALFNLFILYQSYIESKNKNKMNHIIRKYFDAQLLIMQYTSNDSFRQTFYIDVEAFDI